MSTTRVTVRLTPRGGADEIDGRDPDGALYVRVRATPVDGEANRALVMLLADRLGVPRTAVRLVLGARGRRKVVEVDELPSDAIDARWPAKGSGLPTPPAPSGTSTRGPARARRGAPQHVGPRGVDGPDGRGR